MAKWSTIAPLHYWDRTRLLTSGFSFTNDCSLSPTPAWLRSKETLDRVSDKASTWIKDSSVSIVVEYEATSAGDLDPNWQGKPPRTKEAWATELIYLVYFSLWLSHPTEMTFSSMILAGKPEDKWLYVWHNDFSTIQSIPKDVPAVLSQADLELAKSILSSLRSLENSHSVWLAVRVILQAQEQDWWEGRYLFYWVALEALFGPDSSREITYRLATRAAFFLSKNPDERKQIFQSVKEGYESRSAVVHGMRIDKLTPEKSQTILQNTEDIARRSLLRILTEPGLMEMFQKKRREAYLDDLIFKTS